MSERIELPIVTETDPEKKHVSLMLIADGLRQAEKNLSEQESNIKKFSEQVAQLQNMRIATIAQKNLLTELEKRIKELDSSEASQGNQA
jgi:hypothetical protein